MLSSRTYLHASPDLRSLNSSRSISRWTVPRLLLSCPLLLEAALAMSQGLRDKTKAMKAMASELNMYQAQVNMQRPMLPRRE